VAALGSKVVLIGSPLDNTGAMNAGAAYAFKIPPPQLRIQGVAANAVQVSWFSPASDFVLQDNTNALAAADWRNVTNGFVDDGTNVTIVVDPATGGSRFYRLTDP